MKTLWGRLLVFLLVFAVSMGAAAQASPLLAFVNLSGQLVVSSGDGGFRWIVTNPGETLVDGFEWADGRVVFAVYDGGAISVRVADPNAQSAYEIGRGAGSSIAFGGVAQNAAVVAFDGRLAVFDLNGGGGGELGVSGTLAEQATNGGMIFFRGSDGNYALIAPNGGSFTPLGFASDPNAPFINLWSGSLVAYADYGIGSSLAVTDANSGATVTLANTGSIPLLPLAWTGSTLIYRGSSGTVLAADLSGINSGANPLETGVDFLPGSATEVQTDGRYAYFLDGETVGAVDLGCLNRGDCLNSVQIIGGQAAPETVLAVSGRLLTYTGYSGNAYDLASRELRAVDLGCLGGQCQPASVAGGATAGYLSPDGSFVTVQDVNGGLSAVNLRAGGLGYLSDGGELLSVRWSE
ncbi:MAG: hypothetical protein J0M07_29190 [Anaerolineae bacterium]|nr:hypothetical protein [Anaerolineae bacterium]